MGKGLILVILLFGILGGFASCKKETQLDLLMHTWKVDEWILAPAMQLSDSIKNEMIKSSTIEFKPDSTFIYTGMNPEPIVGKYRLNEQTQTVTLIPTGVNQSYGQTVKELTKNRLVLIDPTGNKLVCSH